MTCDEAREAFTDLYDGTLSGPPLTALSQHLDGCRACRLEWAAFRKAMQALGDLRDEEPSPGFAARVVERIEGPTWWRRAVEAIVFPLRLKLPLHAAALVLLGVAGVWISQRSPELRQAVDLGAPAPAERFVPVTPPAPLPDKTAEEPRAEARRIAPPPAPPVKMSQPPAAAPVPAPLTAERGQTPAAVKEEPAVPETPPVRDEAGSPAAAPIQKAMKAESESAAATTLRSSQTPEPPGAKAKSGLRARLAGPAAEKEAAGVSAGSADDLFSAAATEYAAQNYPAATEHFRTFLAQRPKDKRAPDAQFFLAEGYRAERRHAEAAAAFDAFLSQYPDHRRAPVALYRQGESLLALGDASGCRILREALEKYPGLREASAARAALAARCQ
ncbi:MAG: outer membrane protein assembly factor BamD [candidate division NC10 bacterium]|nr:outer membrane protein assembly factor BamD [candidate division NC10 bacterium]